RRLGMLKASAYLVPRHRLDRPEREERSAAPDAENRLLVALLLYRELDQIVEDRPGDQGFETIPDQEVGRRLAGFGRGLDADRMIPVRRQPVVDVRAEPQRLSRPLAFGNHLDGDERRIDRKST